MNQTSFLLVLCLLFVGNAFAENSTETNSASDKLNLTLSGIPDTRQSTEYSCAAAALQAVLGYWGRDISEQDLMEMLNTDRDTGTYPDDILRVAREMGLNATYGENLSLEYVETTLREGVPIIVDCQAWRSVSEYNESWSDEWDNGHWVVIIGLDEYNVYIEDPYILGSRGKMSRTEFLERWHNPRGLDDADTTKQIHMGIAIRDDYPERFPQFRHVD
jgi:predicted double-glycine peptidase